VFPKGEALLNGEKLIKNIIESKSPSNPTIRRITPTAGIEIPATVVVTAKARIAPTAMRNRLKPVAGIPISLRGSIEETLSTSHG
jgi:hypothetical protein